MLSLIANWASPLLLVTPGVRPGDDANGITVACWTAGTETRRPLMGAPEADSSVTERVAAVPSAGVLPGLMATVDWLASLFTKLTVAVLARATPQVVSMAVSFTASTTGSDTLKLAVYGAVLFTAATAGVMLAVPEVVVSWTTSPAGLSGLGLEAEQLGPMRVTVTVAVAGEPGGPPAGTEDGAAIDDS